MFSNMKRVRELLIQHVQQFVASLSVAEAIEKQLLMSLSQDFERKVTTERDKFKKQEETFRAARSDLHTNTRRTLSEFLQLLPLSGVAYDQSIWSRPEWTTWSKADNRGLKPEDRKGIDRTFFEDVFPVDNRLGEYVLFGSAQPHPSSPAFPLFFSPSRHHNLIIRTAAPDKTNVYDFMYSLTLRLLTAGKPGSVNLLMIDPVKLGEKLGTFSTAFRELPRVKSLIQGGLALTEERQIEEELIQLRTRIAEIVQTMGDNFSSLEDYNLASLDIQEPYRILVIRDFPKSFSRNSIEKLLSIMSSGPKCGVYTILHIDESMTKSDPAQVSRGAQLSPDELVEHFYKTKFDITRDQFMELGVVLGQDAQTHDTFTLAVPKSVEKGVSTIPTARLLLAARSAKVKLLEVPPSETAGNVVNTLATLHAQGDNLAIPIPQTPTMQWWKSTSTQGLSIDVGTASRSDKLLFEMSDSIVNGLVVGRVGSGKTNLLHVIIQQLCTKYSPSELVLYLIDLKQAEFHAYGAHKLPHAKVVASKTDRAFCLNVLQDVHAEMERRNAQFTEVLRTHKRSVANLAQYREVTGEALPQLLLIADEFTVLFNVDDKITVEARRLIEQIARLGRSSGIHLLLATQALQQQTLNAAIKDQFVMRIALMCDDNTIEALFGTHNKLARTLKRRGEAIFNFVAGSEDANRRAQVYIQHQDTPKFIADLHSHATTSHALTRTPMVFEGNIPSRVLDNPLATTAKAASAFRGRELKLFYGQEMTLANTHISTGLSDVNADNVIVMGARTYEKYVSDMIYGMIQLLPKQFDPAVLHVSVYDGTFNAETETSRLSPVLTALAPDVVDITDTYQAHLVMLADLVYTLEQTGTQPEHIEVLVLNGVPRSINNTVRLTTPPIASTPRAPTPTSSPDASLAPATTEWATPFAPGSDEAIARKKMMDQLMAEFGGFTPSQPKKSPQPKPADQPKDALLASFGSAYTGTPAMAAAQSAPDLSGSPTRSQTTYAKLLQYILDKGPAWRVHVVIWIDSMNTLQNLLGNSRAVIDQCFNTRVLFPMSLADAAKFSDADAKAVDMFVPINQLGHWAEPRVMVYDRAQNVSTVIRPYGEITEKEA